jgi:serine protease Do
MTRILNFFVIGLLVGLIVIYQFYQNEKLAGQLHLLRQELGMDQPVKEAGAPVSGDVPVGTTDNHLGTPPSLPPHQDEIYAGRQNAITQAIARTENAVVGINVVQVREVQNPLLPADPLVWMLFDERSWPRTVKQRVKNLGSGFIISSDGYIVTNEHVVQNAEQVVVTTTARQKYDAKVVGTDPLLDMALLKIDATGLPSIPWGDSENAIIGEWVIAIGNPYGLFDVNDQPSVSVGVISAMHRDFQSDGRLYSDMIQTDAAINRGNSGGPLLNADGEAVGMNTLIFSETGGSVGIGFAIPAHRIVATIDDLLKGGVNRNYWIGIRAVDVSPLRARLQGLDECEGALVTSVEDGSPAAQSGIRVEDIILELNGQPVQNALAASEMLRSTDLRVGSKLSMKILRRGKTLNVEMTLAPLPTHVSQVTP